jgi:hypothetical protein
MSRSGYVGFRANEIERNRLRELATATGKSMSAVFRELVMNARLEKTQTIKPVSDIRRKANSTGVRQDNPGAVVNVQ